MSVKHTRPILLVVIVGICALFLSHCSDDKAQNPTGTRIVGDPSLAAQLLEIELPEDCGVGDPAISSLTGRVNNVDLNSVKIMLYSTSGVHYGTLRVFNNDGSFSMDLPCGRRVRLLLTKSGWTSDDTLDSGPPDLNANILASYWDIDRVLGTISGLVLNAFDNSLVEGVQVIWDNALETGYDTTDVTGVFSRAVGLTTGTHTFEFHKAGFAVLTHEVTVPDIDDLRAGPDDYPGDLVHYQVLSASLPPLTATLSGTLRVIDPVTTDTLDAVGIDLHAEFSDDLDPHIFSAVSDGVGAYMFQYLPAAVTAQLHVFEFEMGGSTYGPIDTSFTLWPGETTVDMVLNQAGGAVIRVVPPVSAP